MLYVLTGCPADWANYREKCYFFSKELHSFNDAKALCESMSSSLLIINDLEEQVTHFFSIPALKFPSFVWGFDFFFF